MTIFKFSNNYSNNSNNIQIFTVQPFIGYHVMYYVGDDELSYRDYMITNELRELDLEAWYNAALDSAVVTEGDVSHVKTGLVLAS